MTKTEQFAVFNNPEWLTAFRALAGQVQESLSSLGVFAPTFSFKVNDVPCAVDILSGTEALVHIGQDDSGNWQYTIKAPIQWLVSPGDATSLTATADNSAPTIGTPFNVTVTAATAANVTDTDYHGAVTFKSSDTAAVLPADYQFVPADNGVKQFQVTLETAGSQTITVADTELKNLVATVTVTAS